MWSSSYKLKHSEQKFQKNGSKMETGFEFRATSFNPNGISITKEEGQLLMEGLKRCLDSPRPYDCEFRSSIAGETYNVRTGDTSDQEFGGKYACLNKLSAKSHQAIVCGELSSFNRSV